MIPVIALSSLNRDCEGRSDKRPALSDLKDSGALEADADLVLLLYRDEMYDEQTEDQGIAEILIAKHRNGETGKVKVGFKRGEVRFFNLQRTVA
jgi:replicative DNA helicase